MWLVAAIASAVLFGLAGWWMKVSQMKGGLLSTLMLGLYIVGTICFGIHAVAEQSINELGNMYVWLAGIIIGLGSALGNYFFMKALEVGPASLTSPLTNMNIVPVVLLGTVIYDEKLGWLQIVSIVLLIAATILITQKKDNKKIAANRWIYLVFASLVMFAVRNGGLKITEELGYSSAPVLFIAYLLSILLFIHPVYKDRHKVKLHKRIGWKYGLVAGFFSYAGLQLFAIALTMGQASLVAPIFATNGMFVTIGSILVYKERLNQIQTFAFVCLIIGLICIRISL